MKTKQERFYVLLATMLLALPPALAQPTQASNSSAPVADSSSKTYSQQELDQLLAPIALYPDALLAQIFMASTYPLEVVEAARWVKDNSKVAGKPLEDAMAQLNWDPAVKALTSVPQVLQQMSERLEWTQKLGDAFLAQQNDVMKTVQSLRAKADASGNLKSSGQMDVKKEVKDNSTVYVIESPKPDVVYVPTYNPTVVYGTWAYPAAPPYYVYPPSYVYPPGLAFATGVAVGAAIWGNCDWDHHDVDINVNRYNNFNRTSISNAQWNHNVEHRRGVAYSSQNVARQYRRGGDIQAAKAREDFRGRAELGRNDLHNMDRNELNNRVRNAERAGNRATFNDRGHADGPRGNEGNRLGGGGTGTRNTALADRGGRSDGFHGNDGNRLGSGGSGTRNDALANRSSRSGNEGNRLGARGAGTRENGLAGIGNGASAREASARGASSQNFGGGGFHGGGGRGGGGGSHGGGFRR